MRLNKKKLAALAMSAVMAASTMPFPVLAEEFTDMGEATVVETYATVSDVVVDKDGNVTITYYDEGTATESKEYTTTTNKVQVAKPECGVSAAKYAYKYVASNGQAYFSPSWEEGEIPAHDLYDKWVVTKDPSCTENGEGHHETWCRNCEKMIGAVGEKETIAKTNHTLSATPTVVISKTEGSYYNIKPESLNGIPELSDKTKDGWYTKTTYYECSVCHGQFNADGSAAKAEKVTVKASDVTAAKQVITLKDANGQLTSNIKGQLVGLTTDATGTKVANVAAISNGTVMSKIDVSKLVLDDPTKPGKYWEVTFDANDKEIFRTEHTVAKEDNATYVLYSGKTKADTDLLKITTDKYGFETGVTTKSCVKTATYYEITYSASNNKVVSKSGEKTAEPSGEHSVNYASKTAVDDAVAAAKLTNGVLTKGEAYTNLVNQAKKENSGIKITRTGCCEDEGTLTVTYLCRECGEPTGTTVTMKAEKLGHSYGAQVKENEVEATCDKDGSYDIVRYCEACGKREVVREGVKTTKPHSFIKADGTTKDETNAFIEFKGTVVVDYDGDLSLPAAKGDVYNPNDYLTSFRVTAAPVVKCDTCGQTVSTGRDITLTVVECVKESEKKAGSITLKATSTKVYTVDGNTKTEKLEETYTVPYYSNWVAYIERNPEEEPLNGLVKDEYGVWRYFEDGEFQKDFTGIVDYEGGRFFVANGVLCSDAKGLNLYNGEWYFLAGGQIQTQVTGLAMYNGEWFFLTNGKLDRSKSGLVEYDGAKFIVAKGELQRYSGLWQDPADGTWYFAALGQIQEQYTGTAIYDGQTFELVSGKLVR